MDRVINTQDIEKYPDNYSWLEQEQQTKILGYMNGMQALAQRYFDRYSENVEENKRYLNLYQHTLTGLTGAKNAYVTLGIMVEFDFPRAKNEWILATKEDAQAYIDYQGDEIAQDSITDLIDYGDIQ